MCEDYGWRAGVAAVQLIVECNGTIGEVWHDAKSTRTTVRGVSAQICLTTSYSSSLEATGEGPTKSGQKCGAADEVRGKQSDTVPRHKVFTLTTLVYTDSA